MKRGTPLRGGRAPVAALIVAAYVGALCGTGAEASAAAAPACAQTLTATTPSPARPTVPGGPCWSDVTPYPFGSDGLPVDPSSRLCRSDPTVGDQPACYLTATSMAFRAWNRGLAATSPAGGSGTNAFGVWIFNGTRWFPDPVFPGSGACKGTTVVWAGKLDYWLIGGPDTWPSLCRFDGVNFLWEPLPIPATTLAAITPPADPRAPPGTPKPLPKPGSITSAACNRWDDCRFFGAYGIALHWDGSTLSDASPDPAQGWLGTAFTAAIARADPAGDRVGVAVGTSSAGPDEAPADLKAPLPATPDGSPPPELYASSGGPFGPLAVTLPSSSVPGDPNRTDLVAIDLGTDGQGWIAGDPAGLHATTQIPVGPILRPSGRPGPAVGAPEPAPLQTITASGAPSTCAGIPSDRFAYANVRSSTAATDAFLWSSISVFPGAGDALAGGLVWPAVPGPGSEEDGAAEPVIVRAGCDGTTSTTRFRIPDPLAGRAGTAPADRSGTITALAANATNDAWAATSRGGLDRHTADLQAYAERPHLYRLTDGQAPAAAAGDDSEPRPLNLQFDPTPIPPPPAPPVPPPAPAPRVVQTPARDPAPTVYGVQSKIRGSTRLELVLTFKLRRPVTLGAEALRGGQVVSSAPMRRFRGRGGKLVMAIDRKRYPTGVRFVTDSPAVALAALPARLSGTVHLQARPQPYRGRRIVSVSFQLSPRGKGTWTTIGTATGRPWSMVFDAAALVPGRYDLRAVATDDAGRTGASAPAGNRAVTG